MTITEFLLARIAEDEAGAPDEEQDDPYVVQRVSEERMLAECEAKRRIVELHPIYRGPRLLAVDSSGTDFACETCHATSRIDDSETLLALASVYADHPDFDPAWRLSP